MTFVNPTQSNQAIAASQGGTSHPIQEHHDRLMRIQIMDTLQTMHEDIHSTLATTKSVHIPGTWEVITQFIIDCCRRIGSLFT